MDRQEIVEKDVVELKHNFNVLDKRFVALEQKIADELPHLATKADLKKLRGEIRLWIVGSWATMFFSLAALQVALHNLAKP
jgi:hypothetical protein